MFVMLYEFQVIDSLGPKARQKEDKTVVRVLKSLRLVIEQDQLIYLQLLVSKQQCSLALFRDQVQRKE